MSANPTHALSAEPAAPRALDPLQPTKGMVLASGFCGPRAKAGLA